MLLHMFFQILFNSKTSISALGPPNLLLNVRGNFYTQRVKWPGRDANRSHLASGEVENDGKYTSLPPV